MDIKSRIEQIISNNIEIGETENRLDYIVHNTSELAEKIVKLFAIPVVSGCFSADDIQKAYQAGAIETLTDGTGNSTPSFNDLKEIEKDAKEWFNRYTK